MARTNRFSKIDKILPITLKGTGKAKSRKIATDRTIKDQLAGKMAECQTPSELAMLASKFGFKDEDIIQWAKDAPNFGMFRMRVGNRLRGVVARIASAKKKGVTLTVKEAAYAKRSSTRKKVAKKAIAKNKKAKAKAKTSKKKVAKKTATPKATKKKKRKRSKRVE